MPGDFMAEDHRLLQPDGAKAAVIEIVEVGPANAADRQPDRDLPRTRRVVGVESSIRRSFAAWMTMAFIWFSRHRSEL